MTIQSGMSILIMIIQIVVVLLLAWVLRRAVYRLIRRLTESYNLPPESLPGARRAAAFVINGAALLLILERMGVSASVLWAAFSGFAAVGAVAFFAAWSVLSNIFCTMLIFTTNQFRINDYIEVIENGEKPGFKGRVIDINLIYTTLEEPAADQAGPVSVLHVPNNMFFQRGVRRWRNADTPPAWWMRA